MVWFWKRRKQTGGANPTTGVRQTSSEEKGGHDAPIVDRSFDDLERWPVARSIYRAISFAPSGWSTRIGIYGAWGHGKTSTLNFLQQIAESEGDIVVRLSAWDSVADTAVIGKFYEALLSRLQEAGEAEPLRLWSRRVVGRLLGSLSDVSKFTSEAASSTGTTEGGLVAGGAVAITKISMALGRLIAIGDEDLSTLRAALRGRRVIAFIDDLDRADPKVVPKTLLALRELLDWPGFSFIMAFDRRVIASALGEYSASFGESANQFLEKIIDIPFDLPSPTAEQVERLADRVLKNCCPFIPGETNKRIAKWMPRNPRQAKLVARTVGTLRHVAERHEAEELHWYSIFLQAILRTTCPELSGRVEEGLIGDDRKVFGSTEERNEFISEMLSAEKLKNPMLDELAVRSLIYAVIESRYLDRSRTIDYEMSLFHKEPSVTKVELLQSFNAWLANSDDAAIAAAIDKGIDYSGQTQRQCSEDYVRRSIDRYFELLDLASDTELAPQHKSRICEAESYFSFMSHILTRCSISEVCDQVRSSKGAVHLYRRLRSWVHFRGNDVDIGLRQLERNLMLNIVENCNDQVSLFFDAGLHDPHDLPSHSAMERDAKTEWDLFFFDALSPRLVEYAVDLFYVESGIRDVAISPKDSGVRAWLFESKRSPIYATDEAKGKLLDALNTDGNECTHFVVARNCFDYLGLLCFDLRSASWMSDEDFTDLVGLMPDVLRAAWNSAVKIEPQYRFRASYRSRRAKLITRGASEELFQIPNWME